VPTFESIAQTSGTSSATGIPVPAEVVESLGAGKRVPIVVTINGHSYRSSVAPYRGEYMIALSAEHRAAAGVEPGQAITVAIEVDTEPRIITPPEDLQAALDANPAATASWHKLSYSHQRQHVLAIEDAKTAETRTRRISAAIEKLTL
jgi:hypothetical protein